MWDKIKKFAQDAKHKTDELVDKGLKAAPDLAKKAAVGLQSSDEFEAAKKAKRFVVVMGRRTDLTFQKIIAKMPYYQTLAFISSTRLKTMELDDYTDFARSLEVAISPTVLYYKNEQLQEKVEGTENAEAFLAKINTLL